MSAFYDNFCIDERGYTPTRILFEDNQDWYTQVEGIEFHWEEYLRDSLQLNPQYILSG